MNLSRPIVLPAKAIALLLAIVFSCQLCAQQNQTWEKYIEQMSENEDVDDGNLEQIYDELSDLSENKIDSKHPSLPTITAQVLCDCWILLDFTGFC